jgi:two-component system cell cycle sensor histidine kinase/response regulator CckA
VRSGRAAPALLVTDVVMPDMNGRQLAQQLERLRPGLKCLFMSGYTADVISQHGVLEPGLHFVQKPFSVQALAAAVRHALDG